MFRKKVADEKVRTGWEGDTFRDGTDAHPRLLMDGQDAPEEMISAAMPVAPPRERVQYGLDDFDLLATLGADSKQ